MTILVGSVSELAERHRQHDGPPPSPHNFFLFPADFTCSVLTIWPNPKYKTTYFWNKAFFGLSRGETAVSIKSQSTDESRGGFIQIIFLGSKYTHTHTKQNETRIATMTAPFTSSIPATNIPVPSKDSLDRQDSICCSHSFPVVLHEILDNAETTGMDQILSWMPTGRAFKVHDKKRFLQEIVPKHFRLTKYKSFCRQMNLWNFKLEKIGLHKGECK